MIYKRLDQRPFWGDDPSATLINAHSRGLERTELQKVAAADSLLAFKVQPKSGHSYVHLIALGAGETYGPNSNADFFPKEASELFAANGKPIKLTGGLVKQYPTFEKYAAVYREHRNSRKGGTPLGKVASAGWNERMNRVELILELPHDEFKPELEKLAAGQPFTVSMGSGVPEDICSICGNRAKQLKDYCTHLKNEKLSLYKTGHVVCSYNDLPYFHDISIVRTPADKTAYALRKVASAEGDNGHSRGIWLPKDMLVKIASGREQRRAELLEKLSAIEKRMQAEGMLMNEHDLAQSFPRQEIGPEDMKKLCDAPTGGVISSMNSEKVMLPPQTYIRIVTRKPTGEIPGLDRISEALPEIFSALKEDGPDALMDGAHADCGGTCPLEAKKLTPEYSLADEPVQKRVLRVVIDKPGLDKTASGFHGASTTLTDASWELAKLYAKYQLDFLAQDGHDKYAHRVVMRNQDVF